MATSAVIKAYGGYMYVRQFSKRACVVLYYSCLNTHVGYTRGSQAVTACTVSADFREVA